MKRDMKLFNQLKVLTTEARNNKTLRIDTLKTGEILKLINSEDRRVAVSVAKELPWIARGVELVVAAFKAEGRLIYVGAGTSGRLGILDASECPPTFGTDESMVRGIIAGGKKAVFRSQEGSEDKEETGATDLRALSPSRRDVVCGIAASMRTPYVLGALREAKRRGAHTILITTNPRTALLKKTNSELRKLVDVAICPVVGPEVIMGSTRMKSGTAQKMVLNMITTTAMIQLGKVYQNMMVDLRMNSKKLEERAKRVLMIATDVDYATANDTLMKAGGHVKSALIMIECDVTADAARKLLVKANGFVRAAIGLHRKEKIQRRAKTPVLAVQSYS